MAGHLLICKIEQDNLSTPEILLGAGESSLQDLLSLAQIKGYRYEEHL